MSVSCKATALIFRSIIILYFLKYANNFVIKALCQNVYRSKQEFDKTLEVPLSSF